MSSEGKEKAPSKAKLGIVILLVILAIFAVIYLDLQGLLRQSLDAIQGLGVWAPIAFILIYVSACILFIPGSILTLGAGVLFGVVKGSIFVSIGSILGATVAFLIGRYLLRGWVNRKVEGNAKFRAMDDAVAKEGWKIVGLMRLSPIFPFNLLNYSFGLTSVSLRDYFFASWVGMIPGTVMYVYLGSVAGSLASLGMEGHTRTPGEWALYGIGLVATVMVTIYVTRIAAQALREKVA